MTSTARPALEVRGLSVVEGSRQLLAPSSFTVYEGQRVLLVGPSGAGKSLFVDLLLGFAGPETPGLDVGGRILLDGQDRLGRPPNGRVGAVFQVHRPGIFDDLTIRENLRFGDRDPARAEVAARDVSLTSLDRSAAACSGGEQVRVVLARTLLSGGDVLVCDEPTAGLDAGASAQVVRAIAESHRRLTIVVTHDYDAFEDFADVVLLLDPSSRTIRPVPAAAQDILEVRRTLRAAAPPPPVVDPPAAALGTRVASALARAADGAAARAGDFLAALAAPFGWLRAADPLDGPRVRAALRRDLAPGVAAFVALGTALIALTATYFLFARLPKREYAEALFLDDLLAGLGVVQVRVAVPLLVSLLLAAKLGASTAASIGHMSRTRQIDALRLLEVSPRRHLLIPAAAGQLAAAWIHTLLALGVAYLVTLVVFLWDHAGWSALFAHHAWMKEVRVEDLLWVAGKTGVGAIAVSAIAFRAGATPKRRPEQVVQAIHRTLLEALLAVLAIHAVFAFLEFA